MMDRNKLSLLYLLSFIKIVYSILETNQVYAPTVDEQLELSMVASHVGFSGEQIPYRHEHDRRIELDILLIENQVKEIQEASNRKKRNAIRDERYKWKNNIVPYQISNEFSDNEKELILKSIELWEDVTCIDFVERSPTTQDYVDIIRGSGGCYSYLGRIGGAQDLALGGGCVFTPVIIHELGHALGLFHHQSRPDRDMFVDVLLENVAEGLESQFQKLSVSVVDTHNTMYDYRSVMHYGEAYFSKNGQPTIKTKDPKYQDIIGRALKMSFVDTKTVNAMYKCGQKGECPIDDCPEPGFRGKYCQCYCPTNEGRDTIICEQTDIRTCTEKVKQRCESWGYAYRECKISDGALVTSVAIINVEGGECTYNYSYGFVEGKMWVDHGCRATFDVCYERPIIQHCTETVKQKCESWDYAYTECQIQEASHVTFVAIDSVDAGKCIFGQSYGREDNKIWVNNGCRADFDVCYEPQLIEPCSNKAHRKCESWGYAYKDCEIPDAVRVKSVAIISIDGGDCFYNYSYGFVDNNIWVNHGCRANFDVCYETRAVVPCAEKVTKKCESWRYAYAECEIANATNVTHVGISSVRRGECIHGESFGSVDNRIWVNNGCQAYFDVCYDRPSNGPCIDTVKQTCGSLNNSVECVISKADRVTSVVVSNVLGGECTTDDSTYGVVDNRIWVNQGCRASFLACFEPRSIGPCFEKVKQKCESWDYAYAVCEVQNAMRVTYVAKATVEGGICSFNESYGMTDNKIWVNNGCRAYFDVCYEPTSCYDQWKTTRCSKQKKKGRCSKRRVRKFCKLTCNNCGDISECSDVWSDCGDWRQYCNTWKTLKSNCKRTYELC